MHAFAFFGARWSAMTLSRFGPVRRGHRAPPAWLGLMLGLAVGSMAFAQPAALRGPPHVGYAYPAGGQQGTTFTMSLGGQSLAEAEEVLFAGPGLSAKIVSYDRPMTQKEFNDLREKIQSLMERRAAAKGLPPPPRFDGLKKEEAKKQTAATEAKKAEPAAPTEKPVWTPEDEKVLTDLRTQAMTKRPNRQGNPAIAETVTLEVRIAADARIGEHQLRLRTPSGLSNPVKIQVGDLPEFTKPVVTATMNPAPRGKRDTTRRPNRPQNADREITLPATVNGQILPGAVDRYRFNAKQGEHLTVAVSARSLIPYLADAVPGWFQATVALYDEQGREVAYGDSFRFDPDPVLAYEIPADGEYAIEVKDSIYRGREDFVYRIAIGERPFVTSIFPLGGRDAGPATFQLTGWNLPMKQLTIDTKDKAPGTFVLAVRNRGQLSNVVRFALDQQPETLEAEPNDKPETAQRLSLPIVVDGRIDKPGDRDLYRIDGKAGEEIVAEIFARRLGSPLDSSLTLTDASGKQLAFNDDFEDKGAGLMTHQADSRITAKLPADGVYFVEVTDVEHHGGQAYGYRLRVGAPQPDFELRVVPSSINVRAGTHTPITVYALRRDGFNGEILLGLENAPRGFGLSGARIPPGQDKVTLTLAAPQSARDDLDHITVVGAASIDGKPVGHVAVPAEDMMQAFAYHHLVPAEDLLVDVIGRPGAACRVLTHAPVQLPVGGKATLEIGTSAARGLREVQIELTDAPEGITAKAKSNGANLVEIELTCDAAKVKPGLEGNLILNAYGIRAITNGPKGRQPARIPLGSVPAIPFQVIAPPVAVK